MFVEVRFSLEAPGKWSSGFDLWWVFWTGSLPHSCSELEKKGGV
jgi:hypothetical protein